MIAIEHAWGKQAILRWLLYDGHGNLMRFLLPDGRPDRERGWQGRGVWGEVQSSLGTGRGYCSNLGHSEDETGLVYMHARYYEPATGRFLSEDPSRDGVNWYLYADGNPVNRVDYSGCDSESEWFSLGAVLTAIAVIYAWLIPVSSFILKAMGRDLSPQIAATLSAIVGGSLSTFFAAAGIYAFMKALGGLESELRAIFGTGAGWVAARLFALYQDSLKGLSRLGNLAGGIGLTAAFAAATYMGITFAALLLTDSG